MRAAEGSSELLGMVPQLLDGFEEDDLLTWAHHTDVTTIPDEMLVKAVKETQPECSTEMQAAGGSEGGLVNGALQDASGYFQPVTFAMSCRIEFNKDMQEVQPLEEVNSQAPGTDTPVAKKKSRAETYEEASSKPCAAGAVCVLTGGHFQTACDTKVAGGGLVPPPAQPLIRGRTSKNCAASLVGLQDADATPCQAKTVSTSSHKGGVELSDASSELSSSNGGTVTSEEDSLSEETEASTEEDDSSESNSD